MSYWRPRTGNRLPPYENTTLSTDREKRSGGDNQVILGDKRTNTREKTSQRNSVSCDTSLKTDQSDKGLPKTDKKSADILHVTDHNFCKHCGEDISEGAAILQENYQFHHKCVREYIPKCENAVRVFRRLVHRTAPILRIGINVTVVYGQKKQDKNFKKKRTLKINELLCLASALRNSKFGFVFVQLVGLEDADNFTGAFDEFADIKLNGLINDGSSFTDVYKKQLLSAHTRQELNTFTDILVLSVEGADFLETAEVNTKSALDDCIIDTPEVTLRKFVRKKRFFKKQYHQLPIFSLADISLLQESRHIQTKACFQPTNRSDKLVNFFFEKLRLAEYLSAFSKNELGGSVLIGVTEEVFEREAYRSKRLFVKPVVIDDCKKVESLVQQRISQTVLVCDYQGQKQNITDLVRIFFMPERSDDQTTQKDEKKYVLHVSVRPVNGVVFYDKEGPKAYRVDGPSQTIRRMDVAEWFMALNQS